MIRLAEFGDLDRLMVLAHSYAEKAGHPSNFDETSVRTTFEDLITRDDALFLVNDDISAALAIWVFPVYFNYADQIAQAVFVWSDRPGDGARMIGIAEKWAKQTKGARYIHFQELEANPGPASLYRRLGYKPLETTYVKEL